MSPQLLYFKDRCLSQDNFCLLFDIVCIFFYHHQVLVLLFFFKSNPASTKIYKDFVRSTSGQLIVLTLFLFAVASMCASVFRCFLKTDDKNTLQAMSDDTYDSMTNLFQAFLHTITYCTHQNLNICIKVDEP